jgi:hypothetical protein
VTALEYAKKCEYMENTHRNKNLFTYQFKLETTEPMCCTHNKKGAEGENIHVDNINQLAGKHCCGQLAEKEQNKFI